MYKVTLLFLKISISIYYCLLLKCIEAYMLDDDYNQRPRMLKLSTFIFWQPLTVCKYRHA